MTVSLLQPGRFAVSGGSQTFTSDSSWTVPAGVTSATFDVQGGQGSGNGAGVAQGGRVVGTHAVTAGESIEMRFVLGALDGFGLTNGRGGTSADVRRGGTALANRIFVGGGGGGHGGIGTFGTGGNGGHGGGTTGAAGANGNGGGSAGTAGGGGTQAAGGSAGSTGGSAGASSTGGAGGAGAGGEGGGGGAGYFGGGGGGAGGDSGEDTYDGGGGGGGSNFAAGTATSVTHTQGYRAGAAQIIVTW